LADFPSDQTLDYVRANLPEDLALPIIQRFESALRLTHDYAERYYREFANAAQSGSLLAMVMCARMLREGQGCVESKADSFYWATEAAKRNFPPGLLELGLCYEDGLGVNIDEDKAILYYTQALDLGLSSAGCQLALLFERKDEGDSAVQFATRAADLGDANAANFLGNWFEAGELVERNERKAAEWYERASKLGSFFATGRLRSAYEQGELGLRRDPLRAAHYSKLLESQLEYRG
jgi:hypothetical protein